MKKGIKKGRREVRKVGGRKRKKKIKREKRCQRRRFEKYLTVSRVYILAVWIMSLQFVGEDTFRETVLMS